MKETYTSAEIPQIVKDVNKERLDNKNDWYFITFNLGENLIQIKGYNTWMQIFRINGLDLFSGMDISVGQFKENILTALNKLK